MFFDEYSNTETLAEIVKIDPAIAKARMRLETVTANEEFRHAYETRRKALSDWTTGVNTAFERGMAEGRIEGRQEGIEVGIEKGWLALAQLLQEGKTLEEAMAYLKGQSSGGRNGH